MLHPEDTFDVDLDRDEPGEGSRVLTFICGTAGDWRRYEHRLDKVMHAPAIGRTEALLGLIDSMLAEAKGMDALGETIGRGELLDLALALPSEAALSEMAAKKSRRLSRSNSVSSAPDAIAAVADA